MSFYVAIAGAIFVGIGHVLVAVSTIITAVKGNQSQDKTEKGALRAAAGFLGVSILFSVLAIAAGIVLAGTKNCSKKNRIVFLIFLGLFVICYIIALVIIGIYMRKRQQAGDTAGARDLRSSLVMPIVAIPLYLIGFILLYVFLGRRMRAAARFCKQAKQASGKDF